MSGRDGPTIATAPTPLQRARTLAAKAHSRCFHDRLLPQQSRKRPRSPGDSFFTVEPPAHGWHGADKETQVGFPPYHCYFGHYR